MITKEELCSKITATKSDLISKTAQLEAMKMRISELKVRLETLQEVKREIYNEENL
jgi:hypothetical protein